MNQIGNPSVKVQGSGTVKTPGLKIPLPSVDDLKRDAATDLAFMLEIRPDCKNAFEEMRACAIGWITRAAQSEHFARALEAELEKTRNR